jgi:hypothetical protein
MTRTRCGVRRLPRFIVRPATCAPCKSSSVIRNWRVPSDISGFPIQGRSSSPLVANGVPISLWSWHFLNRPHCIVRDEQRHRRRPEYISPCEEGRQSLANLNSTICSIRPALLGAHCRRGWLRFQRHVAATSCRSIRDTAVLCAIELAGSGSATANMELRSIVDPHFLLVGFHDPCPLRELRFLCGNLDGQFLLGRTKIQP